MIKNRMYNEEIKQKFLDTYENEGSKNTIKYLFYNSYENEVPLDKDLYDFDLSEIRLVIFSSNPKSISVARQKSVFISQYISWAIENNLRKTTINPLQDIRGEWFEQFVDPDIKQYISLSNLHEMEQRLVNYQDIAVLRLLFEGVYGQASSEIRNLKFEDINQSSGEIRLYDDKKGERKITVSQSTLDILNKAYDQKIYQNNNGETTRQKETDLLDNEYVVRPTKRGRVIEGRVSQTVVMKRIKMISELFDMEDMTPKSITRSGMIYMAYRLLKESGKKELTKDIFEAVGDRFNLTKIHQVSSINNQEYSYHNRTVMSEFINEENIKKLYPDFH
ncbi:site-specific integrase [Rossellomorea marisflavi]|uniref:site-specific integrase n=1 Tax=Rossellomorea marisflavi TaxID=189381 RepID=UPI0025AFC3CA|nr:site-specific integrase [Rossellomorea marisflavi]WJV20774.1 site-specific integrase [Rossellomorea marisflavi]